MIGTTKKGLRKAGSSANAGKQDIAALTSPVPLLIGGLRIIVWDNLLINDIPLRCMNSRTEVPSVNRNRIHTSFIASYMFRQ
jgi:hypothetical protein